LAVQGILRHFSSSGLQAAANDHLQGKVRRHHQIQQREASSISRAEQNGIQRIAGAAEKTASSSAGTSSAALSTVPREQDGLISAPSHIRQRLLSLFKHLKTCSETCVFTQTIPTFLTFGVPFTLKPLESLPDTFLFLSCLAQFSLGRLTPLTGLCILLPCLARAGLCGFDGPVRIFKPGSQVI
jgi:hypothetical protein